MPAGSAIASPTIWTAAPAKPPASLGSASVSLKPLPAIVAIVPPIDRKAAATSRTTFSMAAGVCWLFGVMAPLALCVRAGRAPR